MKKLARLSLTLVLLASTAGQMLAQTRPRRVGGGSAPATTTTRTPAPAGGTSGPDVTAPAPTAPARKPTLEAGRP
ncbi:MAG TPA: hypothetical protein VNZ44_01505, partial [Pyrinomonadaceae bacterium]|nr:hypothetical protein [Pyrinomonadaceae bacterium]